MGVYLAALLAALTALQSCVVSTSVSTASGMVTADLPVKPRMLPDTPIYRLLRTIDTNDKSNEERVLNAAIEKLTGLVRTGVMKISGNANLKILLTGEQGAADVLKMFQLDKGISKVLASRNLKPKVQAMESYLKEVNKINGNDKLSVIGIFTTHYGDAAVARALVVAQKKATTHDAANTIKQLRSEQLSAWMKSEKTVDDVFELLKLRQNGYKALGSPKLEVLDDYMKMVIQKTSGKQTLLQTLTNGFEGEEKLAALLVRAKEDTSTSELATALQNALMNKWIETDKLKPENVVSMFRLDQNLDALVDPNVYTLAAFISMYNARNPTSMASLIGTFTRQYGDDVVALALGYAKSDPTKRSVAIHMQQHQFQAWQKSKKSAVAVFKELEITLDDFVPTVNHKFDTLSGYIKVLNTVNRDQTDMITVLSNGVGGDGNLARVVATVLLQLESHNSFIAAVSTAAEYETALFKRWFKRKIEPTSIYARFFHAEEASPRPLERNIVARYGEYYSEKIAVRGNPMVNTVIHPRRS
ncbi:hypothetical protein F444_14904 [Phytophthora nicotianae P1976]|uniref:RxLR effector protein n=1 Tax=Phytophthora nicotianae P1976 TaxID=1317066 RepID=A0A080ZNN1_PHYNI|nr:hypothetical protein F444_14904 [Phytophthora nicotianae P1976]